MRLMRKSSNRVQVVLLVLAMLLAAGVAHARGGLASASGHGNLVMEGALRTFSFQARVPLNLPSRVK